MSNLLLIFTVVFVLAIALACAVGALMMAGGVKDSEEPPWRRRKVAGPHHLFKNLH
ncbi:MAG TPA: hypothetical protein VL967_13595 [Terracidiphilus sp.]|nr:hypothetical protein [Terracidiphilus sp.]